MTSLTGLRRQIEQRKGQRDQVQKALYASEKALLLASDAVGHAEQAQLVAQTVAQATQMELEYHVSEIVTLALASVFPDPYEFKLEFQVKRNQTEANFWFVRKDEKVAPMTAAGGGAVDVASFALRPAMWSLQGEKTAAVLVLDEPFRFLSRDLQCKAAAMLREISERLGLQVVMVSHNKELIDEADRAFEVTMRGGVSDVRRITRENSPDVRDR